MVFLVNRSARANTEERSMFKAWDIRSIVSKEGFLCSCSTRLIIPCDKPDIFANRVIEMARRSRSTRNNLATCEHTALR